MWEDSALGTTLKKVALCSNTPLSFEICGRKLIVAEEIFFTVGSSGSLKGTLFRLISKGFLS